MSEESNRRLRDIKSALSQAKSKLPYVANEDDGGDWAKRALTLMHKAMELMLEELRSR